MKEVKIVLSNRLHYTLILIGVLIVGAWVVVAYGGAYGDPAIMGHTADEIDGLSGGGLGFGDWETKNEGQVYQATSDGIVIAYIDGGYAADDICHFYGYTEPSSNPTTTRAFMAGRNIAGVNFDVGSSFTMPVKNGDYWKVGGSVGNVGACPSRIHWIPTGSGSGGGLSCSIKSQVVSTSNAHSITCDSGLIRTGGGCRYSNALSVDDYGSYPIVNGWECYFDDTPDPSAEMYVVCCDGSGGAGGGIITLSGTEQMLESESADKTFWTDSSCDLGDIKASSSCATNLQVCICACVDNPSESGKGWYCFQ